jgi:CheY-like chemotaxis protein/HPt (histidine-containing phosphotransfer) domain-containing protein
MKSAADPREVAEPSKVAEPLRGEVCHSTQPANNKESGKGPLQILLVDDSAINQTVALRLLNNAGLNADTASNGREAIAAHEKNSYDLILMDVQMPEMDGLEATRRIRAIGNSNPVVIALTGNAQNDDREKCLAAGMNDYISRPFDPDAFAAAIKQWATKIQTNGQVATVALRPLNAPTKTIVNVQRLEQFTDGSALALRELVDLYLENTAKYLTRIESALATNNMDALRRAAHKAAGSSATCGMDFLAEAFRALEHNVAFQSVTDAAALLRAAHTEFERVQTTLASR